MHLLLSFMLWTCMSIYCAATTTASPTTTMTSVTTTTIPAGMKKTTASTGGICISKSGWNKNYLCMDHLEPLVFGCHREKCFLQCQKGQGNWCYPQEQSTGTTRECSQHHECGDAKLLCKDQCTESQLDRFSALTAEPTASTYTPTTSTPSTTITTTTATTTASPTTTTTSVTTTTIPAGMKKTTASTETAKWQKDKCSRACSKIHDPVCDTKGKTHENPCLFKEESCRARQNGDKISIAKYGKCSETAKYPKDKCSRACSKIHDPVCDSNGKTHENRCLFKEESCRASQKGDKIAIAKYGKCLETAKWDKCSRACPKIEFPVCDSNGKTHINRCHFEEESCRALQNGDKMEIAREGKCSDKDKDSVKGKYKDEDDSDSSSSDDDDDRTFRKNVFSLGQNRKIADPKCTAVADRNWGGGYGGKIVFQASNCYNTSYAAVNAVGNVGYFCSDTYKSARCHGKIHWWMQFDRPVNITSVSFEEPPKKQNAEYKIWFTNDIGKERETFMAVPAYTANKFSRAFQVEGLYRYLGISSQGNCIEYEKGEGDYYWAIQNLKFSVVA